MALIKRTDDKADKIGLFPTTSSKKNVSNNSNAVSKVITPTVSTGLSTGLATGAAIGANLGSQVITPTESKTNTVSQAITTPVLSNSNMQNFNYGPYQESQAVIDARNALNAHNSNRIADWTGGTYGDALKQAMDRIVNREKFSYDLNGDALYRQYKDQYINQGRLAMQDTIGQASAMTGGYGNSYASTVGNQAYQGYLQSLNNVVPELYQLAIDKYNREGDELYNQYSMYNNAYNTEYGQYRDSVSDWYTESDRLTDAFNNAYSIDYGQYSDNYERAFSQYQQKVAEDQHIKDLAFKQYQQRVEEEQYAKDLAFKQAQLAETIRQNKANEALARQKALYEQRKKDDGDDGNTEDTGKKQYASWGASEWQQYFASIRNSEGTAAAQKELQEFTKKGYIPTNMTSYAAIGARGKLGH